MSTKFADPVVNDNDNGLVVGTAPRTHGPGHVFAKYLGTVKVKPHEEPHVSLGIFTPANPAKGFSVEVTPDATASDDVVTQITSIGSPKRYELILHISNFGSKTVSAEVWKL